MSTVNSAKGVLVVDPLEARGVRYTKPLNNSRCNGLYVLFQIDSVVHRTNMIHPGSSMKWKEGSQCRFDISPEVSPVLQVFLMQGSENGMPVCLGKGEMNLIEVFYQKESDRWISLSPCGQLDVELTFYEVVPMLPVKQKIEAKRQVEPPRQTGSSKVFDEEPEVKRQPSNAQKMISSVDRVFEDDVKEERGRLKKLAMKVKRRYKESVTSNYADVHRRKASQDMLIHELKVSPVDKDLPEIPSPLTRANTSPIASPIEQTHTSPDSTTSLNSFSRARVDFSTLTLEDPLNSNDIIPFSASSIGSSSKPTVHQPNLKAMRQEYGKKKQIEYKKKYVPLTPEMYALVDRLEKGLVTKQDFQVDEGVSSYNGDGTWSRGCLRDSVPTGIAPILPPKIPVGMMSEEFFALNKRDYLEYFRSVRAVRGI